MSAIEFFFDYHSPWCFLAAQRIDEIAARVGRPIRWRPFHLARLIERIDGRRSLEENAAFVRWYRNDLQDWVSAAGLQLRYHPDYPLRPARALRATLYADTQGRASAFVRATMSAYWTDNDDISDLVQLGTIGERVGLPRADVVAACSSEAFKHQIESNTDEAIERGVFGAPTFLVDERMYWGNDRLQMMELHLTGTSSSAAQPRPS